MKIDLHIHTNNSLCSNQKIEDIFNTSRKHNIKCIAITDHNQLTRFKEPNDLIVISGEEISTTRGHIIGLDLKKSIPKGLSPKETIKRIKAQGGFVILPHPFDIFRKPVSLHIAQEIDAIEVINGRSSLNQFNRLANTFAIKHNLAKIANSDAHFLYEIGKVYTEIKECKTKEEILNEIKNNQTTLHGHSRGLQPHIDTFINKRIKRIFKI